MMNRSLESNSSDGESDSEVIVRRQAEVNRTPREQLLTAPKTERAGANEIKQNNNDEKRELKYVDDEQDNDDEKEGYRSDSGSYSSSSSVVSVREVDVYDFMVLLPDYAYSDPKKEASYNFRKAVSSIPRDLIDLTDGNGNTILLIACQFACVDLVDIILRKGANPHHINDSGANGLHFACYKDSLSMSIVKSLLQRNVSVNVPEKQYGCTPLHYAASAGNLALCKLLIAQGAYIHAHDYDGCDSIAYAKDAGMEEVAAYLTDELSLASNSTSNSPIKSSSVSHGQARFDKNESVMEVSRKSAPPPLPPPAQGYAPAPVPSMPIIHGRPTRILINTNSASFDSSDATVDTDRSPAWLRKSLLSPKNRGSLYDFIPEDPPISPHTWHNQYGKLNAKTLNGGNKSSMSPPPPVPPPRSHNGHSVALRSSAGADLNRDAVNNTSSEGEDFTIPVRTLRNNANKKHTSFQPTVPSPYKPINTSPENLPPNNANTSINTHSSNNNNYASGGTAKGKFSPNDAKSKAQQLQQRNKNEDDAPSLPLPSVSTGRYADGTSSHTSSRTATVSTRAIKNSNNTAITHANTHSSTATAAVDLGDHSDVESTTDLSPEKFELYIERAKFNAKLMKEQAMHRALVSAKDSKIQSLQSEVESMNRIIQTYKEEKHVLQNKLEEAQLPFMEATNHLQEELQSLRRENTRLRMKLGENTALK